MCRRKKMNNHKTKALIKELFSADLNEKRKEEIQKELAELMSKGVKPMIQKKPKIPKKIRQINLRR